MSLTSAKSNVGHLLTKTGHDQPSNLRDKHAYNAPVACHPQCAGLVVLSDLTYMVHMPALLRDLCFCLVLFMALVLPTAILPNSQPLHEVIFFRGPCYDIITRGSY